MSLIGLYLSCQRHFSIYIIVNSMIKSPTISLACAGINLENLKMKASASEVQPTYLMATSPNFVSTTNWNSLKTVLTYCLCHFEHTLLNDLQYLMKRNSILNLHHLLWCLEFCDDLSTPFDSDPFAYYSFIKSSPNYFLKKQY